METEKWPAKLRGSEAAIRTCADDGGFQPRICTSDLARNNHAAIRDVFPDNIIRSCWWHLKECILRWKWDGLEKGDVQSPPKAVPARLVREFEKTCGAATLEDASRLSTEFLRKRIKRCARKECLDWSTRRQDALIADLKAKLSSDFLATDLTKTFLDVHLPENIDLLNIL